MRHLSMLSGKTLYTRADILILYARTDLLISREREREREILFIIMHIDDSSIENM